MKGINFGTIAFAVIALFIGGFLASWILPMMPITLEGWSAGIFTGFIQMIMLAIFGLTGKMNIWTILLGGLIIFAGGLLGGFVAGLLGLSGLFATVIILAIQAIVLAMMGYVRGGKKTKIG